MQTFEQLLQCIEQAISQLRFDCPPKSLYDPIAYTLALGGKRIRPALTLMACNLYNKDITQGHRKNILGNYKYIGVGVIFGGKYKTYYTENFFG